MIRRRVYGIDDKLIMSFQTNKNGVFNPSIEGLLGTLIWEINGTFYATNSPSVALVGSIIDVRVYANNVVNGATCTNMQCQGQNIIGTLDFTWFKITGVLRTHTNPLLISLLTRNEAQTILMCEVYGCGFTSLNFSKFTITAGCYFNNNANLTSILFSPSGNVGGINSVGTKINTLDLSGWRITGLLYAYSNLFLTSIILSTNANTGALAIDGTRVPSIDLSYFRVNGLMQANANTALTTLSFPALNNVINMFVITGDTALTSLDLTNTTISQFIRGAGCISLSSIIWGGAITTGIGEITFSNCALPIAQVDAAFAFVNSFFQVSTPIKNLVVNMEGGTNGSPTGGANNTDILALTSRFSGAGFTFTYAIN